MKHIISIEVADDRLLPDPGTTPQSISSRDRTAISEVSTQVPPQHHQIGAGTSSPPVRCTGRSLRSPQRSPQKGLLRQTRGRSPERRAIPLGQLTSRVPLWPQPPLNIQRFLPRTRKHRESPRFVDQSKRQSARTRLRRTQLSRSPSLP